MKHALARGKPMFALDRRRTRHPPSRLAPTEPASCGHPNKANSGARSDPILGERSSASRLGLASVRAPPLPLPARLVRFPNKNLFSLSMRSDCDGNAPIDDRV
jgi:hypothetical protein